MEFDYRNAYRYPGKGNWFDFWNCRIVLPKERRWFFIMPHLLTKEAKMNGFFYFCYSGSEVSQSEITTEISVSDKNAEVRWKDNLFSSSKVKISEKSHEWNFDIETICSDESEIENNLRTFNVLERLHLRNLSFIHRVPTMRGYANGYIKLPNETIALNRAIVYQAKNHGPDFPGTWTWLHVNIIPQFPESAFEIGSMPGKNQQIGIFRWADGDQTKVYATLKGDEVFLSKEGDTFSFWVKDKDGRTVIEGTGTHGVKKEIRFPTPNEDVFVTPESFDGYVSGNYLGKAFDSNYPALGKGIKEKS